ncbi:MAG: hypothetical protein KGL39_35750 [Patescibacteria group bacterium]|nr:hypothetical protein [Patescibacteria group bacterium]
MTSVLSLAPCDRGNDYGILHPISGLLSGVLLVSGLCVVKPYELDPNPAPNVPNKTLTNYFQPGIGCVINIGDPVPPNPAGFASPATQPYVYVLFTASDTANLPAGLYAVYIQVVDSYGGTHDVERDRWRIMPGVTG